MNKNRRKQIEEASQKITDAFSALTDVLDNVDLEAIRDEEQEFFDAMPEALQNSERGEASSAAIDALDTAVSALETIRETIAEIDLSEITDALDEAQS